MMLEGLLIVAVLLTISPLAISDYCRDDEYWVGDNDKYYNNNWQQCESKDTEECTYSTHKCCHKFCRAYVDRSNVSKYNVNFTYYDNLTRVDISHGKIETLQLDNFNMAVSLLSFKASHNFITNIEKGSFENDHLSTLNLNSNKLKQLDNAVFKGLDNLENINLSSNELADISIVLSFQLHLKNVDLSKNKLTHLEKNAFRQATRLTEVDLSHNALVTIDFSMFNVSEKLERISLSHNTIRQILSKEDMANVPHAKYLDVSNNQLSIRVDCFQNTALEHIDLSNNRITSNIDSVIFSHSDNITVLNLAFNAVRQLSINSFAAFQSLMTLNVSHNALAINHFRMEGSLQNENTKFPNLLILDLSNNLLTTVTIRAIPNLQYLYIGHNAISSISLEALFNLEELHLSNNDLEEINLLEFTKMKRLYLNNIKLRNITTINIKELRGIEYLNMGNNFIEDFERDFFENYSNLRELHLNNNKLQKLDSGLFGALQNLNILNLSHNGITEIVYGAFTGLASLTNLDLSHNLLKELEVEMLFPLKSILQLTIDHNKLNHFDIDHVKKYTNANSDWLVISLGNNYFDCSWLTSALHRAPGLKIKLRALHDSNDNNVDGIQCTTDGNEDASNNTFDMIKDYIYNITKELFDEHNSSLAEHIDKISKHEEELVDIRNIIKVHENKLNKIEGVLSATPAPEVTTNGIEINACNTSESGENPPHEEHDIIEKGSHHNVDIHNTINTFLTVLLMALICAIVFLIWKTMMINQHRENNVNMEFGKF